MLGLALIYFVGKYFFKLAEEYDRNKWLFAVLGVVIYYVGTGIGGVILGVADSFLDLGIDWENTLVLSLIALPFGIASVYLFYFLLKKNWEGTVVVNTYEEIQNIGKSTE